MWLPFYLKVNKVSQAVFKRDIVTVSLPLSTCTGELFGVQYLLMQTNAMDLPTDFTEETSVVIESGFTDESNENDGLAVTELVGEEALETIAADEDFDADNVISIILCFFAYLMYGCLGKLFFLVFKIIIHTA